MDKSIPRIIGFAIIAISIFLYGCSTDSSHAVVDTQKSYIANYCAEVKKTQVSGKEFINDGESYVKIKQELVKALLVDAVQQTVGFEIKKRSSSRLKLTNNRLDEEFKELNVEKARGYIDEFSIMQDKVVQEGGKNLLSITLDVDVCVPKNRFVREVVAIGDITWPKQGNLVFKQAHDLVSTAYFENPRFDLIKGDTKDEYYDWIMTGRLVATSTRVTKSFGRMLGNSLMQRLLVNGRPIGRVDDRVVRVSITVYMQAKNAMEKTILSDTTTEERDFPVAAKDNGLVRMIDKFIEELFVKSTKNVFNKLLERSVY